MEPQEVYRKIAELSVVPIAAIDDAEAALPLADALLAGGLPVVEITFRTDAAAAVMKKLRDQRPEILLGAGTILTTDDLKRARDRGACFGVAPGFNRKIAAEALRMGFAFSPGVMTPSDIEAALEMGLKVLKYFPAEVCGGTKMLKALAGPYSHTGLKFVPTGGIGLDNFRQYLAMDVVLAVAGTWVARREAIAGGHWDAIEANCREIRAALGRGSGE